jgi:phosphoserine phosphatase
LGELLTVQKKPQSHCRKEGLHINQTIAVGDGANDLPMLNLAGLGIAFHKR